MKDFTWPTGPVSVSLTNDLLFKHLMQRSTEALHELIASLLHLELSQIKKTEITNPISLGDRIDDKTVILDVNLLMNDSTNLDLEMQVINYHDWIERSVFYTARNFGDLKTGDPYIDVRSSIHIGFLSYTLFEDRPKFYSVNRIMDVEDHHIYTDKVMIGVVDLKHIELATDVDRKYKLDKWAQFFNAETWEELEMLAQEYPVIETASSCLRELTEDEKFRQQKEAREDQLRRINGLIRMKENAEKENIGLKKENTGLKEENTGLKEENTGLKEEKAQLAKKADETVINMLRGSVPVDKIIEYTGYSAERIMELAQSDKLPIPQ